jgi:hypothetical protein
MQYLSLPHSLTIEPIECPVFTVPQFNTGINLKTEIDVSRTKPIK